MKFKPIHQLCLIGMIGIFTFYACTKDSKEEAHLSQRNAASNAFVFYEQNQLESKLAQFWVNYQLFLGLEAGDAIHTLQATVNLDEATTLLHYALNVAFVDPRIAYDQEVAGNFEKNITWPQGEQITNQQLCSLFHQIATDVKAVRNQITDPNKAINRLSISPLVSGNSVAFQINYLMSHGNIWSKEDLNDPANFTPSGINFNAPTPWLSQSSFPPVPSNQNPLSLPDGLLSSTTPEARYASWLFNNFSPSGGNVPALKAAFNLLPPSNIKAAHQYLSSNTVFWTNPIAHQNGTHITWPNNAIPVMTPPNFVVPTSNIPATFAGVINWTNPNDRTVVFTIDAVDCNNPSFSAFASPNTMAPSMLLGYIKREFDGSLTSIRQVNQEMMEYYWNKRLSVAGVGFELNTQFINQNMNHFNTGFYALTSYQNVPVLNENHLAPCLLGNQCLGGNLCTYATEYYMKPEFSHFRILPKAPSQLSLTFY